MYMLYFLARAAKASVPGPGMGSGWNLESVTGAAENSGRQTMSAFIWPAWSTSFNARGRALTLGEYSTEHEAIRTLRAIKLLNLSQFESFVFRARARYSSIFR